MNEDRTVYVVFFRGGWDDTDTVEGVFATREAAEAAFADSDEADIEEFTLDKRVEHPPPRAPQPGDRPVSPLLEQYARDFLERNGPR
jgi:hypothetical protein